MLQSGYVLAKKWGNTPFEYQMRTALDEINEDIPSLEIRRFPISRQFSPDFSRQFHFAPVRW